MKNLEILSLGRKSNNELSLYNLAFDTIRGLRTNLWLTQEHPCPKCSKKILDLSEWEFSIEVGMCFGCDHLVSDVDLAENEMDDRNDDSGMYEIERPEDF